MRLVTFVLKLGALDGSYLSSALSSSGSHQAVMAISDNTLIPTQCPVTENNLLKHEACCIVEEKGSNDEDTRGI